MKLCDLHTHSIVSGHAFGTIRELAFEAAARDLKLIGVTEHGPGIPGTCNPILFRNFVDAPRNLYGVEMLYGSETNVLNSGKVDLDDLARTAFILGMDTKTLCSEDCKGLCARCGADLNVGPCSCKKEADPRLAVLAKLLENK